MNPHFVFCLVCVFSALVLFPPLEAGGGDIGISSQDDGSISITQKKSKPKKIVKKTDKKAKNCREYVDKAFVASNKQKILQLHKSGKAMKCVTTGYAPAAMSLEDWRQYVQHRSRRELRAICEMRDKGILVYFDAGVVANATEYDAQNKVLQFQPPSYAWLFTDFNGLKCVAR